MFAVCILKDFEFEPVPGQLVKLPFPIKIDKGKMVGFLPVFQTEEDAHADYPLAKLIEIRKVERE